MAAFICFVGASTTEGLGDEEGLGWPGRLRRTCAAAGRDFTGYNLGIRGQSSAMIAERWELECRSRLPGAGAIVLSFGNNDAAEMPDRSLRVPEADTLRIAAAVTGRCAAWQPTLWIGPTPVDEAQMPFHSRLLGVDLHFRNATLEDLSGKFAKISAELGVPYLDLFRSPDLDAGWRAALCGRDGLHPSGAGYEALAMAVAAWPSWQKVLAKL